MITTTSLLEEVLESDALYFELGARAREVEAARIAWTQNFADLPAGCVVQRVRVHEIRSPYRCWVESIEAQLRDLGATWSRIYLAEEDSSGLDGVLRAAGYSRRVELAFVSEAVDARSPRGDIRVRPVRAQHDWSCKAALHKHDDMGSDGYYHDPVRWTSLMREKVRTGSKEPYLIETDEMAAGEVAIMESANMLRLKNLYVAPEARGGSLGAEAVAFVQREALRRGKRGMGVFGVEGSPGARTYQKCGLRVEGERVEWSRQL